MVGIDVVLIAGYAACHGASALFAGAVEKPFCERDRIEKLEKRVLGICCSKKLLTLYNAEENEVAKRREALSSTASMIQSLHVEI